MMPTRSEIVSHAPVCLESSALKAKTLGRPLLLYDTVGSTSDVVKDYALRGHPEGLAVMAEDQALGRGRRGRKWESTRGQGMYLSVLLRPKMAGGDVGLLAVLAGVAAACALEHIGLKEVRLKWPNDVLVNGKKIAGVLIEPRLGRNRIDFAVMGIGVNVSQWAGDWSLALRRTATSCLMEGVAVSRDDLALHFLNSLDKWYAVLNAGHHQKLMHAWVERGGTAKVPVID